MNSARPCCHWLWLVPIVQGECRRLFFYRGKTMREVLHISLCAPDLMKSHWMLICHESCALTVCFNSRVLSAPALPATYVEWSGNGVSAMESRHTRSHFYLHKTLVRWISSYCLYWTFSNALKRSCSFFQAMLIIISDILCAFTILLHI